MKCEKSEIRESTLLSAPSKNGGFNIQRKLSIGAANDPLEHEADAMADKVMRMPELNFIQRKCAHCEEEEKAQRKPLISFIQKKEAGNINIASDPVSNQIQSTKGSGNALPSATKSFMESHLSADFSNVNIHADNKAANLSQQLHAHAFTVGNDIYFNEGKFSPQSSDGKRLLAHELTHVLQQNSGLQSKLIQRGEKWDDFWDVGPWDSYKAKQLADQALSAARKTGLPGLHNGAADAWRHCYWNCRMTNEIGSDQAESISTNHENDNEGPEIENKMDLHNNMIGYTFCGEDCDTCCQGKLDSGQLFVIDESDPLHPKLGASSKTMRGSSKQKGGGYKY
jgi:hypothetical protein